MESVILRNENIVIINSPSIGSLPHVCIHKFIRGFWCTVNNCGE